MSHEDEVAAAAGAVAFAVSRLSSLLGPEVAATEAVNSILTTMVVGVRARREVNHATNAICALFPVQSPAILRAVLVGVANRALGSTPPPPVPRRVAACDNDGPDDSEHTPALGNDARSARDSVLARERALRRDRSRWGK